MSEIAQIILAVKNIFKAGFAAREDFLLPALIVLLCLALIFFFFRLRRLHPRASSSLLIVLTSALLSLGVFYSYNHKFETAGLSCGSEKFCLQNLKYPGAVAGEETQSASSEISSGQYFSPNDLILSKIIFTPVISGDGTTKYKTGDLMIKSNGLIRVQTGAIGAREIKNESIKNEDIDDDIELTVETIYTKGTMEAGGDLIIGGNTIVTNGQINVGDKVITQGDIGVGISNPRAKLHVHQAAPSINEVLFLISTGDDASRFSVDEDGDFTADGNLVLGGTITSGTWNGSVIADAYIANDITLANLTQITTRSHSDLQNLLIDDHTQYALLAGRAGGQTLNGDTAASGNLTLMSTAHGTKGKILFGTSAYDEVNNRLGIGTAGPAAVLHLKSGTAAASTAPLKFTSGTLLTTAEAGAVEFLTDAYYGTITTGAARKTFAFLESPTFTGTVTIPTPFTLGAVSVTTTGTQLNYLASATGITGTASTNLVFSTSPTLVTPVLGAATYTTLSGGNITDSGLTATRVTFAGAGGLLSDDADLTFVTDTLSATKLLSSTSVSTPSLISTGAVGITPAAGSNLNINLSTTGDFAVNTNQLYVDTSTGNVGIGTTGPLAKLQVAGSEGNEILAGQWAGISDTDGGEAVFGMNAYGANSGVFRYSNTHASIGASGIVIPGYGDGAIKFFINTGASTQDASFTPSYKMVINNQGNVGIGTASPGALLTVGAGGTGTVQQNIRMNLGQGSSWGGLEFASNGAVKGRVYYDYAANQVRISSDGIDPALSIHPTTGNVIVNSGNVGIGTAAPGAKLEVTGTGIYSPSLQSNGVALEINTLGNNVLIGKNGSVNVGIGTTGPGGKLEIYSTGANQIKLTGQTTAYGVWSESDVMRLGKWDAPNNGTLAINNLGNVGIGTTSPRAPLDVNGAIMAGVFSNPGPNALEARVGRGDRTLGSYVLQLGGTGAPTFEIINKAWTAVIGSVDNSGNAYFSGGLALGSYAGTATATGNMIISGNVGIGTTSPKSKLDVEGGVAVGATYSGTSVAPSNGAIIEGNVGIGTTAPAAQLHVFQAAGGKIIIGGTADTGQTLDFDNSSNGSSVRFRIAYIGNNNTTISSPLTSQNFMVLYGNATSDYAQGDIQFGNGGYFPGTLTLGTKGFGATPATGGTVAINGISGSPDNLAGGNLTLQAGQGTGNATAGDIIFQTADVGSSGGTLQATSTKLTIKASGNVGIGTTSPSALLNLKGTLSSALTGTVAVTNLSATVTGTGTAFTTELAVGDSIKIGTEIFTVSAIASATSLTLDTAYQGATASGLTAYRDPTLFAIDNGDAVNKLTITKSGNVGIGTTSPTALLHLDGSAGKVSLEINSNETTAASNVLMLRSDVASANDPIFRVQADGAVFADGAYTGTGADYAEYFATKDTDLKPGEAVCVDIQKDNAVKRCARSGDNDIMGIVSSRPSIVGNSADGREKDPNYKVIGMLGQITGNVSGENGSIQIGDSLTSANTPGYLRKADAGESTVGVALQKFDGKQGSIQMLISRRNKSLTVEKVEEAVTQRIADMNVQDQVDKMIADAATELARNTETQLIDMGGRVVTLETLVNGYETRIKTQEDLTAILQAQIEELKKLANEELNVAQISANTNDIDYLKLVLGLDRAENGSVHLLGNLEADEVVAGVFTVKITEEEKKTIGNNYIEPVKVDADSDGKDDNTGDDGKSYFVKTKAPTEKSKIFTTFEDNPGSVNWVEKVKDSDGDYIGFKMILEKPIEKRIYFGWWIVESR